jgi:hypothetical protein
MSTKHIVDNLSGQTITGQPILRPYKSYTALLTQSGGTNPEYLTSGDLTIGVTYTIIDDGFHEPGYDYDFTNVGAPNNDIGTSFVATGTNPNSWGTFIYLDYDTATPVVTVLENTLGNVRFRYANIGRYFIESTGLFTQGKTYITMGSNVVGGSEAITSFITDNPDSGKISLYTWLNLASKGGGADLNNGLLLKTALEIRVYN